MIYKLVQPSEELKPFVKHYWILEESNPSGNGCKQRIYPSGFTELLFFYGDRYVKIDQNEKKKLLPHAYFSGQINNYYDILPTGKIGLIAVTFKPDAAKLFLKIPIQEFGNDLVPLDCVLANNGKILEEKVIDNLSISERINKIEDFLIAQLNNQNIYDYKRIHFTLHQINQKRGIINNDQLANYACLSKKQFNRKFTDYIGISPKQFTKIVRFQNTIFNQQHKTMNSLTELAYACGYYDQAHFSNEFKLFTGYSPKEFFTVCEPFSDYFSS